jgi:hypothetical protein
LSKHFFLSTNRCSATQSSTFLNAQSAVLLRFSKEDKILKDKKKKRKEASNIRFLVTLRYQMIIFPIQFQAKQIVTAQELSDFTQLFSSNKFYFTQTLFIN